MDDESTTQQPMQTTPPVSDVPPPITYEETPVITPIVETPVAPPPIEHPIPKKSSFLSVIKNILLLGILFVIGYIVSGVIRNAINTNQVAKVSPTPTPAAQTPLSNREATDSTLTTITTLNPSGTESAAWKQYNPINGTTRKPIDTIQFTLPSTILPPVCDGSACGSQGTYLPGGTRLTIAPRGTGQVLADFRGKVISDAGGKEFVTKQITVAGKPATDFSTATVGSTIGGYAFSTMHGVMIEVTDTLSLEINHFSPSGIAVDFAADEKLFNEIIATLSFPGTSGNKGSTIAPIQ